jgi:hypothetical protein
MCYSFSLFRFEIVFFTDSLEFLLDQTQPCARKDLFILSVDWFGQISSFVVFN